MNSKRRSVRSIVPALSSMFMALAPGLAFSQIPTDGGSLEGDHIRLVTTITGFKAVSEGDTNKALCAPAGARLSVSKLVGTDLHVRFLTIEDAPWYATKPDPEALAMCPADKRVKLYTDYKITATTITNVDYKRSGVTFGGLVVPFKFRLGKSKELVSSATIAPYVGFRTASSIFGLYFTPVLAAGLSTVPVADIANSTTATKTAYTVAAGIKLSSTKNENFNAGLLIGHDYLNKADRLSDPNVSKPWISLYLGYSM